jgi:23S rRNA (uracil1939-C5)-methyltransferase
VKKSRPIEIIELDVESIGFEGVAIARHEGKVHFIKGALPGERVRARLRSSKKRHAEAELIEVLVPSPRRQIAPCPHFGVCGGCSWQHMPAEDQVQWKRQHVIDAFERLGRIPVGTVANTLSGAHDYGFRNKMEFSFGAQRWLTDTEIASGDAFDRSFALGLHVPGRFDRVLNVEHCLLQSDAGNVLLRGTHALLRAHPVDAYHQRDHVGFARHLVVRTSATNGALMSVLITTTPRDDGERSFVYEWLGLHDTLPAGSTLIHAVNDTWSPVAVGEIQEQVGPGYLEEISLDISYRISPFSFFQTNTTHLPALVACALDGAELRPEHTVWDLYCGTGTLTLPAARRSGSVIGLELAASSIADATANAERNAISNVQLEVLDLHGSKAIERLRALPAPDVVIVDPPRAGMHEQVVRHLMDILPPRIVYVSCNPSTQARDCALLHEAYDITHITPVDMFPQTWHVESVAVLVRR